ncbi:MAG: PCRF domain-containing protein, partial [Bifidobacteriaceae bacterium]|nr:PCRF domain-containing protein [Bifidobacteriaceae bacterium]
MEPFVFSEIYSHLNKSLENIKKSLNLPILNKKIIDLESELSNGDIWGDHLYASKLSQKLSNLKAKKDKINNLSKALQEVEDFFELANSENDSLALDSVSKTVKALEIEISDLSILTLLSGKYDNLGAIMSFRAGAGGVEACDWTQMLMRMYERFCDSNNWGFKIL